MGEIFWVCCMAGWQHMKMTAFRVFSKSFLKYLKCFYQKEYFRGQICLPEFENYMIQTNTWKHYLVPLKHVQFLCQLKTLKKWQQECVLKNSKHFIYFHKQLEQLQCNACQFERRDWHKICISIQSKTFFSNQDTGN